MPKESAVSFRSELLARIFRLIPLASGCGLIANKRQLKELFHDEGPVWVKCRWGSWLKCYLKDYVGNSVYYFGDLDPKLSWILQTTLRPGDQFIDVGANLGLLTFLGAKLVGPTGRVLAVDPQPQVLACLEEAIVRNKCENITVAPCGVGNQHGELELHIPPGNLGSASFTELPQENTKSVQVKVCPLHELLTKHNFEEARLVKLDVEDWEAEVVEGAEVCWSQKPPPGIIFEFKESKDISETEVGQRLLKLGYRFYRLPRNWWRPQLVRSNAGFSAKVTHDVFAVHESVTCQELGFSAKQVIESPSPFPP